VRALAALIATLWLPAGGTFSSVQPAGGVLLLSGPADTGPGCIWTTVDPVRLRLLRTHRGSCDTLARASGRLTPAIVYDPKSPWQEVVLSNGRVLFRYEDASDTRPQWVYAPGSLWVYDVWTDRGAQLVRVSLASGRIVQRVRMPKMFRPLLAADADGVWLVPATNGDLGTGPQPLLHVTPRATAPVVVHRGGRAALWLVAHGHTVWMEQIAGRRTLSLWRFDGSKGRRLAPPRFIGVGAVWGAGSIWTVAASDHCTRNDVLRLDPASGRATRVARLTAGSCDWLGGQSQGLAFTDGSLFMLDPPWLRRISP
jgi:hypothetical protein